MNFTSRQTNHNSGHALSDCKNYYISWAFTADHSKCWFNAWYHKDLPDQKNLAGGFDREKVKQACADHAANQPNKT